MVPDKWSHYCDCNWKRGLNFFVLPEEFRKIWWCRLEKNLEYQKIIWWVIPVGAQKSKASTGMHILRATVRNFQLQTRTPLACAECILHTGINSVYILPVSWDFSRDWVYGQPYPVGNEVIILVEEISRELYSQVLA